MQDRSDTKKKMLDACRWIKCAKVVRKSLHELPSVHDTQMQMKNYRNNVAYRIMVKG